MKDRIIKTIVPFVIGWILSLLALAGVNLDPATLDALTNGLTLVFGVVYYVVVVLLAKKWPAFEWLLGSGHAPEYIESWITRR